MQRHQPGFIPRYNPDHDFLYKNRLIFNLKGAHLTLYNFYDNTASIQIDDDKLTLVALLRGRARAHPPNEAPFDVPPYEVILSLPGGRLQLDFPNTSYVDPVQCLTIDLAVRRLASTFSDISEYYPDFVKTVPENELPDRRWGRVNHEAVQRNLVKMVEFFEEEVLCKKSLIDTSLTELIIRLLQTPLRPQLIGYHHYADKAQRIEVVLDYIRKNIHQTLTLQALADQSCMSKASFQRHFKQRFGTSPIEFINQERIRQAKKRLAQPGRSVADVAFEFGFKNVAYFIRIFKRYVGTTPKHYQMQLANAPKPPESAPPPVPNPQRYGGAPMPPPVRPA
ncbi:MAG: AraC family transcriptional regulator [Catalinimonas sp.]